MCPGAADVHFHLHLASELYLIGFIAMFLSSNTFLIRRRAETVNLQAKGQSSVSDRDTAFSFSYEIYIRNLDLTQP